VCGPGAYRPDPPAGITVIADLPQPEIVPDCRNDKRNVGPCCGHMMYRDKKPQSLKLYKCPALNGYPCFDHIACGFLRNTP
jgi:hypothetical protein